MVRCKSIALGFIFIGAIAKTIYAQRKEFSVYWNVPTFQCHKYGFNFTNVARYGILQNSNDVFRGERITILYDPGLYPAIIDGKDRNGGVPQEGNLDTHLKKFKTQLLEAIPDPDFKGIGIIDFEHWRPIFRENWASLDIYRKRSKEIEKKKHPFLNRTIIEKKATSRFEKSAFTFMDDTLSLAISLRPKAKWGYYGYPFCFNFSPKNLQKECTKEVKIDNDRSTWMYKTGTALFPSVYLQQKILNEGKRAKLIEYRVLEGKRIATMGRSQLLLLPYTYYKYTDTLTFLSQGDMKSNILEPKKAGADGIIIWGSSADVNTKKKCNQLHDYIEKVIGPIMKSMGKQESKDDKKQNEI
uniref:Hyaluronidase n=1 Tax=Platymeris rhadamanthus TaxID=1134088 RepID=A0A6B9L6N3_PLARH|nr:venom hyaluronidase 1 [Platymeris rhadamanthus]